MPGNAAEQPADSEPGAAQVAALEQAMAAEQDPVRLTMQLLV